MAYNLMIKTKNESIQKKIKDLKEMRDELLKYKNNEWVEVKLDSIEENNIKRRK